MLILEMLGFIMMDLLLLVVDLVNIVDVVLLEIVDYGLNVELVVVFLLIE